MAGLVTRSIPPPAVLEHYLTPEAIQPFVPAFTHIADELVQNFIDQKPAAPVTVAIAILVCAYTRPLLNARPKNRRTSAQDCSLA